MAEALLAVTTEYVRCFLALMGKGFIWPERVLLELVREDLDFLDVTHVLTHGDVVESDKETADGVTMVIIGRTCDDVCIKVKFWADTNQSVIRILNANRI